MGGRRWAFVAGLAASLLLVPFAIFNRGQRVAFDFGLWDWTGEAVYAVYGGVFVGLLTMFLLGLPADLAARSERQRLRRRVRELERKQDLDVGKVERLPPADERTQGGPRIARD